MGTYAQANRFIFRSLWHRKVHWQPRKAWNHRPFLSTHFTKTIMYGGGRTLDVQEGYFA